MNSSYESYGIDASRSAQTKTWWPFGAIGLLLLSFICGCDRSTNPTASAPPAPPAPPPVESVSNSKSMEFIVFPAGSVEIGEVGDRETVVLGEFHLAVHELTQQAYEQIVGTNPSRFKGDPLRPVENVSWIEAIEYCNRLSELEGYPPYYEQRGADGGMLDDDGRPVPIYVIIGGPGYRLPTRAEWEYAVGSGMGQAYSFGDETNRIAEHAWFETNSDRSTHPVGTKQPSEWGLYDLHGNVWEWCWDEYKPESGRFAKGGSWRSDATECRISGYVGAVRHLRSDSIGFRLARTPAESLPTE